MTDQPFHRVVHLRTRLADEVYEQLFSAILGGQIEPGERLIQEKIAEEMDVSRTPVREALLRLEQERVIERADKRGFVISQVTEAEVRDNYQAREAIEGFAARLVTATASKAILDKIEATLGAAAGHRQDSIEDAYRANEGVHRAIVEATGNDFLLELFDTVWGRQVAMRLYAELFNEIDLVSNFARDHTELVSAMRAGDGDKAYEVVTRHIRDGLEVQLEAMSKRRSRLNSETDMGDTANA